MVSREQKKAAAALHEQLQLLRSMTNSRAMNESSIILDATRYIEELKQKVEILNQDMASAQNSNDHIQIPFPVQVTVETLEKGFLINVCAERSCPGLLVSILEAFDEISLNVMDARVSCTDTFQLQAIGGQDGVESMSAGMIEQAVWQAINTWIQSMDQD